MILLGAILLGLLAVWLALAMVETFRLGIGLRQAFLYVPLKLVYRIGDAQIRAVAKADAPVIYAIWHQSRLDPALMLSLLPEQTLHILDEEAAKSIWLEPWREVCRTITFNAQHIFVSRRLVRGLKGKGRLAVYLPDNVEPDTKSFRLFRAVARIAVQADARIVPVFVSGGRFLPFSLTPREKAPRRWFKKLTIVALPPMTIAELVERSGGLSTTTASNALFDRLAEARLAGAGLDRSLFEAVRDAARLFGPSKLIVEDVVTGALSYRKLLTGARVLGRRFEAMTAPDEAVGVLLPNTNGVVLSSLGLASAGRVAAMVNYTAGPASVTAAVRTADIRTVVSSKAFVEKAGIADIIEAIGKGGAKLVWLEDLRASVGTFEKLAAAALWRFALHRQEAGKPAVILFTSGSEGTPKAVVLTHRNLLANVMQAEARISFSPADRLLNVLPVFHSFGLTGGTILPLVNGVPLFLYPSPLHYKIIPEIARKWRPSIMFGTDTFLAAYARTAKDGDFSSLRFVVAGAEAVKPETRKTWRERFGAEIVEGFGLTEAAPVVAVNTATHSRDGTVGRLLPGMRGRLEPRRGHCGGRQAVAVGAEPDARLHDRRPPGRIAAARRRMARHRRHRGGRPRGFRHRLRARQALRQDRRRDDFARRGRDTGEGSVAGRQPRRRVRARQAPWRAHRARHHRRRGRCRSAAPLRQGARRRRDHGAGRHRQGDGNPAARFGQDRLRVGAKNGDGKPRARPGGVGSGLSTYGRLFLDDRLCRG